MCRLLLLLLLLVLAGDERRGSRHQLAPSLDGTNRHCYDSNTHVPPAAAAAVFCLQVMSGEALGMNGLPPWDGKLIHCTSDSTRSCRMLLLLLLLLLLPACR
jgi:hypothetical protein